VNQIWLDFLDTVLPDKDTQKTLQQAIGYLFIKDLKLEKVIFLYGIGSNGKSVIFEVLKGLLTKEMMSNYSLASLTNHLGYQLADLNNRLINYGTDISMKNVDLAIFKQVASGEDIGTRQIREKAFTMRNYAKLIFNVNKLDDADVENTNGFGRRLLFIPFEQVIDKKDQDKNLHKTILENKSGVMNWIIEGIEEVLKNEEIYISEKCENFLDNFKRESSPIQLFIELSNFVKTSPDSNEVMDFQQMYEMYKEFCKKQGEKAVAQRNLNADLKRLGFEFKRRKQGNVWFAKVESL
jgi:putative DNA primase/helicase